MIYLTDFFDAASRRYNNVILLPAINRMSGNEMFHHDSAPAPHAQQLNYCVKKRLTSLRINLWPPNSPDLRPVEYEIWAVMQHRVYHRQIHSVDELKRRLTDVWCNPEHSIFDEAIDQWQGRHRGCVHAKGGHFAYSLWSDNADSVHICYIQCDLFDCYIFNYETMPSTLAKTFLFILQGSALADLRYGGRF